MNPSNSYVKKLHLPANFSPAIKLEADGLIAKPLSRDDLKADLAAVNSSIDIIQKTRGGAWPNNTLSEEFDLVDLAWHERELRELSSFAYAIYNSDGDYIGCFYLYPMGHRTDLTTETERFDVDASWWVTTDAYKQDYYPKVYQALQKWLAESFPFTAVYYSNREIPG